MTKADFLDLEDELNDEQRTIRNQARAFVDKEVLPIIRDAFEEAKFPLNLVKRMGDLGFLGAQLHGYGCAGVDALSYGLIMGELERGDSALRSFASVQGSLVMYPILAFGSDEQKNYWLPRLARGEAIGCFGLTEPEGGSDPANMRTCAKRDQKGFVLNGVKTWITNAAIADVIVVFAKTESGVRGFLVEKNTPGLTTEEIKHKLSMRASSTGTLYFDDCRIPAHNVLEKSTDLRHALMCLSEARFGIAFGAVGAAEDCFYEALEFANNRMLFNKKMAGFQLVQRKLAIMASEITKANLVAFRIARLKMANKLKPAQISMAKQNNVAMALECARVARDMLGASGITSEFHSMRHASNLESVYTYEGTNDIHLLIMGKEITGLDAFG
ncbi:MAG TPA: acyl-CoA dehydrogenase family protein [Myxococcota bacterium]|nr:acyl-CoA dehydrogenase family protein [Myxococcota bacterium]